MDISGYADGCRRHYTDIQHYYTTTNGEPAEEPAWSGAVVMASFRM